MKTKFSGILTLFLAFMVQITFAQQKTVSGTVSDDSGPLPGVSVVIKGTLSGTETDFDGKYSIKAKAGDILQFSFVGMESQEKKVGDSNTINVSLKSASNVLDEVVVTAQGIKREKKALGYAVSTVNEEQLSQRSEGDVARVLSGKTSGVQINAASGVSGSATNIIIRGYSSFSQSNQPLFIVDGVPFNSNTFNSDESGDANVGSNFVDGNSGSSRFLDLDPNSIASVSVLKGLAAATLYGSQGRNGVILITTKAGTAGATAKKTEVTVSQSYFYNEIASLPDYQNEFGGGFDQAFGWFFSNWGPSFRKEGVAGWGNSSAFDANGTLPHPYSTAATATGIKQAFPEFAGVRYKWQPYNNVQDFFRTGTIANTSVNIAGASSDGKVSYNMNYGNQDEKGFTPGNSLRRANFGMGGRAVLSNKFTVNGTMNYARTDFKTPPVAASTGNGSFGDGSSIFGHLFFTPRSIDLTNLPFQNPITGESVYYRQGNDIQNPNWTVANSGFDQNVNRVFGSASLKYDLNDNINLVYNFGMDFLNERNTNFQNKGGKGGSTEVQSGIYQTWDNNNTIWDHTVMINGNYKLNDDMNLTFNTGVTSRSEIFDQQGVTSSGQNVFGVLRHFNFNTQTPIQFSQKRNILGALGQVDLDYKNYLYLKVSGRNDWLSNLTTENRTLFYPSASVSFIPTAIFAGLKSEKYINYLKLRAGYGTSAGFPTGFPIASTLNLNTRAFQDDKGNNTVTNTTGASLGNPNLKPEQVKEFEVGIESRLFNNRVNLEVSLYTRNTTDLIVDRPLDPSTGFTTTRTNIGKIHGEGFEIDLGVDIFKAADANAFGWNTHSNFTVSESTVKDLGLDTDIVVFDGFSNLGNAARVGDPLGVMVGSRIKRDAQNRFVVNSIGNYVEESGTFNIGDPNPDWIWNISNEITYKNFNFGFLFNWTHGGDIYSSTTATLLGRGLITETIDRNRTFILPGVREDGSPNNIQINNSDYYFSNVLFGPNELQVYDGSVLRLQEVSLGYTLPKQYLEKTPFGSVTFTASGYNLWYDAYNTPKGANFDPNVAGTGVGNGRGFEYLNGPSSKRYGFSLKATF